MFPREHGAYGQLLLPLVTAVAIGRPSLAALALAIASVAAFVAHEPLLVLLGRRGERMRREAHDRAFAWLAACAAIAFAAGAIGAVMLPATMRWSLFVPVAFAAPAAASMALGRERSASGEILAASALASVSFPAAIASDATVTAALTCTSAFVAGFIAATVSVRAVISGARGPAGESRLVALATAALPLTAVAALAFGRVIHPAGLWAAAATCGAALAMAAVVPPPRYLRRIGWSLVAATLATGAILVATLR